MYKNQLQELAQRSCFNLPSYTCIREGPDHAPRFKAAVNFNGDSFESPSYCSTLRQAEHSAAEVALSALSSRGPSNSLAARILDETGVYKNLLQEVSQRVGAFLPAYTTFRSGLGHLPVFTCTVELAGVIFTGEPAKNKKQAEKNAALAAWLSLKSLVQQSETSNEKGHKDEQEHVTVARALQNYLIKARLARLPFPIIFPTLNPRPSSMQQTSTTSKILPLICPKAASHKKPAPAVSNSPALQRFRMTQNQPVTTVPTESRSSMIDSVKLWAQKFPAAGAPPYVPVRHCNPHNQHNGIAAPVMMRNAVPVFAAPPLAHPQSSLTMIPPQLGMAQPVRVKQAVPTFAASVQKQELSLTHRAIKVEDPQLSRSTMTPARVTETLDCRTVTGGLEALSLFSNPPVVQVQKPISVVPNPEIPKDLSSQSLKPLAESQASTVITQPASSKPSSEETPTKLHNKLEKSTEIEDLKDLEI